MTTNSVAPRSISSSRRQTFLPIVLDVAAPIGAYYLLRNGFGMSAFASLAWSSVVPAARTGWAAVAERTLNAFAALILFVNAVSLLLGFVSGDARLMLVKESAVGSVIGIGVLVSVGLGKPMMTAGMKPWVTRGQTAREAAWTRLESGSEAFRRAERRFSMVWGAALLGECVVRVVGAYSLPVDTMVWLGTVLMIVTMGGAFLVGGVLGAGPMLAMVAAEVKAAGARVPAAAPTVAASPTAAAPELR
ncbi:VC0807 family protein [Streptomyces sp. NPDC005774]|uniref:VC0807 family protein n=1 Tax=Streptomyces sp. NPDC005774 TaxID=3364728 RepID=UPI0036CC282C